LDEALELDGGEKAQDNAAADHFPNFIAPGDGKAIDFHYLSLF
jgi:hypothetical protein